MQVAFGVPAKAGFSTPAIRSLRERSACARNDSWCLSPIFQHLQRRQPSRRAHNPAARVRGRSAHIKVLNRSAKARPSRDRAQKEKLFQRQLTLKNISFAQSPFTFEIKGSDHLLVQN